MYKLDQMIDQLSFRVRLFIETIGGNEYPGNLSEREIIFLEYLERKGEVAGFSEFTAFFKKISPSTVSNTLKKLYQKGLVTRIESPQDLRSINFSLTDEGRGMLEPVKRDQAELSRVIAESLDMTVDESGLVSKIVRRAVLSFDAWMGFEEVSASEEPRKKLQN